MTRDMQEQTETLYQLRENGNGMNVGAAATPNPQYRGLSEFRNNDSPTFRGTTNPIEAEEWLLKPEKIFRVMRCVNAQKVDFATCIMESDAEHLWNCARGGLLASGTPITWNMFKEIF